VVATRGKKMWRHYGATSRHALSPVAERTAVEWPCGDALDPPEPEAKPRGGVASPDGA
jgi:hypothetical protein